MAVRPLDECVGDAPSLIIQRFGLAALYNKCRCVLHRRYLAEPVPSREHDYSRKQCLDGALTLLNYQHIIWKACKPGNVLSQNGWFVSSLAVHDFLLAAIVVYLVIQDERYSDLDGESSWMNKQGGMPTKDELKDILKRSHAIWSDVAIEREELRKTADTLATILARLGAPVGPPAPLPGIAVNPSTGSSGYEASLSWPSTAPKSSTGASSEELEPLSKLGLNGKSELRAQPGLQLADGIVESGSKPALFSPDQQANLPLHMNLSGFEATGEALPSTLDFDASWISGDNMDWVRNIAQNGDELP